jgi:catechol 2,3-dioxygenase-like lactoylglutathione lyase family enzyme
MPTPTQLLLLRASLWHGEPAFSAWAEWRHLQPDLDTIDEGSYRLLPLLYRNLAPQLAGDPDAGRLKGVYRRSWAVNQLGLRLGRKAINALADADIEVLVLKGAALISVAYMDHGARPMGDVDLAVAPEQVDKAVQALRRAGFAASEDNPERLLSVRHSLAFRDPDGQEVDLHRGLLWRAGLDEEFWQGSIAAEVAGAPVRVLNPADQLLHVCAHGAAWNPIHPLRWAADAFKVIEVSGERLDWERLMEMARRGRLTVPFADSLDFLAKNLAAPVPEAPRRALAQTPVSRAERRAHEALAQPPSSRRSLAMLAWFRERHRAQAALDGTKPGFTGFVRYMQGFWGLERPSQVPAYAARRLLRRRP